MAKRAIEAAHRTMLEQMADTWDRIAADVSDNKQNN